jgi:hypothetical protein
MQSLLCSLCSMLLGMSGNNSAASLQGDIYVCVEFHPSSLLFGLLASKLAQSNMIARHASCQELLLMMPFYPKSHYKKYKQSSRFQTGL